MRENRLVGLVIAGVGIFVISACASQTPSPTSTATPNTAAPGVVGGARSASGTNAGGSSAALAGAAGQDAGNLITGTIASATPGYITVNTQRGPLRLAIDDSVRATSVVDAAIGDLNLDDNVAVTGERAADGSVTAQTISLNPEPPSASTSTAGQAGPARGEFFQRQGTGGNNGDGPFFFSGPGAQGGPVGGSGAQLTAEQVEQQVQQAVASGRVSAEQAASLRERLLAGGARVGADGTPRAGPGSTGTPPAGLRLSGARLFGRVSEIAEDKLAIETANGRVSVAVTAATVVQRVERVPASELPVGTVVSIAAERDADGVVRATSVLVGETGAIAPGFGGPIRP